MNLKNHLKRVSMYSELLADLMCIEKHKINLIKEGAFLHDIGKTLIDIKILNKPSTLTSEEFEIMKEHTKLGVNLINANNDIIKNIITLHHEKWNGTGYPCGLKEFQIPIEARIVSIVDCYDALTSKRPYKDKLSHSDALNFIKNESGKSFDPEITYMFILFEKRFEDLLKRINNNEE